MPALQSARFYRDAIAHWPKCFIEQFKRGQEMTDRLVFIGTLGSLVAGLVGTWLTKSPAPTGTESGLVDSLKAISPWVALGSLALLVLLSFLASVRKEHETRLSGANDAANKKLSGYASANLALRQRAEAAEHRLDEARAELAKLSDGGQIEELVTQMRLVPIGVTADWTSNELDLFDEFGGLFAIRSDVSRLSELIRGRWPKVAEARPIAYALVHQWSLHGLLDPVETPSEYGPYAQGMYALSPIGKKLSARLQASKNARRGG